MDTYYPCWNDAKDTFMDINISDITQLRKTQQSPTIMQFNITWYSFYNVTTFSGFIPELAESCSLYVETCMQVLINVTQMHTSQGEAKSYLQIVWKNN